MACYTADCIECVYNKDSKCTNKEAKRYGQAVKEEHGFGCDDGLTQQAYDYKTMTPWDFSQKYYTCRHVLG